MKDMTPTQQARVQRRLAHAAASFMNSAVRKQPVQNSKLQSAKAFVSLEARKANLTYAMLRGIPLDVVETAPNSNSRRVAFINRQRILLNSLGFNAQGATAS